MSKMKIVSLEPNTEAKVIEIENSLEGLQGVVGGYIEVAQYLEDDICLIDNEEGKVMGLALNRALRDKNGRPYDVIVGTAFICAVGDENFIGLTDEQAEKYRKMFEQPDVIVQTSSGLVVLN